MSTKRKTTRRRKSDIPSTRESRKAINFESTDIKFDDTNEQWIETYIPSIRFAFEVLNKDRAELERSIAGMCREGIVQDLLEGWCKTKDRMECLVEFLDAAFTRTFVVLDGMGYSPTNLPPSSPVRTN